MKTTLIVPKVKEEKYPILKEYTEDCYQVVLFIGESKGVVVMKDDECMNAVGFYSESWAEDLFHPFVGKIILEND